MTLKCDKIMLELNVYPGSPTMVVRNVKQGRLIATYCSAVGQIPCSIEHICGNNNNFLFVCV